MTPESGSPHRRQSAAARAPSAAITGGANNPNPALAGQTYYGPSPSEVLVPVYGGQTLSAGGDTATIVGFMQIFIQYATHSGNSDLINVVVLKVMGCASGGDGDSGDGTPSITDAGGAPVPIRLIRTQ